jgi:hypothetical protein
MGAGDHRQPFMSGLAIYKDPGDGGTIAPVESSNCAMTTAAAETRVLADPVFLGQLLYLTMKEYAVGDAVVTASNDLGVSHSAGTVKKIMTFAYDDDHALLMGVYVKDELVWRLINDDTGVPAIT